VRLFMKSVFHIRSWHSGKTPAFGRSFGCMGHVLIFFDIFQDRVQLRKPMQLVLAQIHWCFMPRDTSDSPFVSFSDGEEENKEKVEFHNFSWESNSERGYADRTGNPLHHDDLRNAH